MRFLSLRPFGHEFHLTLLIRPIFSLGPLMTVLTGFHCNFEFLSLSSKEIFLDVVEMTQFKGETISVMSNKSESSRNASLMANQIRCPSSFFRDALSDKLASGKVFCC